MAESITNGVRCRASSIYLPHHPSGFAYSIRLARTDGPPCQLKTRHWKIFDGSRTHDVIGEGVVGKFPVLTEGGWRDDEQVADLAEGFAAAVRRGEDRDGEFVYQSFSGPMPHPNGGTFEGTLEFHPGDAANPTGPPLSIACPLFRLRVPEFLF